MDIPGQESPDETALIIEVAYLQGHFGEIKRVSTLFWHHRMYFFGGWGLVPSNLCFHSIMISSDALTKQFRTSYTASNERLVSSRRLPLHI